MEHDLTFVSHKLNLPENLYNVFKNIHILGNIRPKGYKELIDNEIMDQISKFSDKIVKLHKY